MNKRRFYQIFFVLLFLSSMLLGQYKSFQNYQWSIVPTTENIVGRHENTFIDFKGKFYLLGGRGVNPVNVFNPQTFTWETKKPSPFEMHHFQAVVYGDAIYLVGAMTGPYPVETPLENIYMYYPGTDTWVKGPEIPASRRRGSAGIVIVNDKIYNKLNGKLKKGYQNGETVVIKINSNATTKLDTKWTDLGYTSPQMLYVLVRQLIEVAGVSGSDIIITDPSRYINEVLYKSTVVILELEKG